MRRILSFLVACSTFLMACSFNESSPNIVIIYADDLGYGDIQSYHQARGKIPTPHINHLTQKGMSFIDAHSSSAVCSPSRYTLLTGRYHWRTRLQKGIVGVFGDPVILPERMTIASIAKQKGYQTACIGKWHLGWDWPIPEEQRPLFSSQQKEVQATEMHRNAWQSVFSQPIPGGPTAIGFDEYFGTDVPNWPPFCFIEGDQTLGIPSEFGSAQLFGKNQASVQGPSLEGWDLKKVLPALGTKAVDFIARMSGNHQPFLLYLPLTSPHTPLSVNSTWEGKSGLGLYADLVMETDAIVGLVIDALEKYQLLDNTLIIFTSDNGCAPYIGNTTQSEAADTTFSRWPWHRDSLHHMPIAALEQQGHYPSGPLRGYKSDAWEGGHRVPFIVSWPGQIKAGSVNHQLVHQADIMATIAELLNISLPNDAGEDSFSFLAQLKGSPQPIREYAVSTSIRGVPSMRHNHWKLILASGSGGWSPSYDTTAMQLYHLDDDIGETNNLASEYPNRIQQMTSTLKTFINTGRSTPGENQENEVEVVMMEME